MSRSAAPRRPRSRTVLLVALCATIALGLATRRFPSLFPSFIARYGGDALWAVMVYWIAALVRPRARVSSLGAVALIASFTVEASQLYRVPWLDALRATRGGALVLGQGFLWSDLVCYAVGVSLAVVLDLGFRGRAGDEPGAAASTRGFT